MLVRKLGLLALVATGVCTVIGGGINVLTVMIQKEVSGISSFVPLAFLLGSIPAVLAALCFGSLSSAMPRAGGSYIYVSRGLSPFWGFMATFSEWFGLTAAIGVIAYADMFLLADAFHCAGLAKIEAFLRGDLGMILIPLLMTWIFWAINVVGIGVYGRVMIVLMFSMFSGGIVLIITGLFNSPEAFCEALMLREGISFKREILNPTTLSLSDLVHAAAILFFAYIGLDTISQAGDETKNASHNLPLAFILAASIVVIYYTLYSFAVYHAIPWQYIFCKASNSKISAPGLMALFWPKGLAIFVILMAAVALANDIPPMQMATSRLFYAWCKDGIFPKGFSQVSQRFRTPHRALTLGSGVASAIILECHFEGFFLGVDLTTMALIFTYILVAATLLTLPAKNIRVYREISFLRGRGRQLVTSFGTISSLLLLFSILIIKDPLWQGNFRGSSFLLLILVLFAGAAIFIFNWHKAKRKGVNLRRVFESLPQE